MEALLLQNARLGIRIRGEYAKLKRDPDAKYFTYVLLLQNSKVYVGSTDNVYCRLLDHKMMSPSSAVWVKKHGPVQRVIEIIRNCSKECELYKTLEYMTMFGWENVRGASYCKVDIMSSPMALQTFKRKPMEFEYMDRTEMDEVCMEISKLANEYLKACPPPPTTQP